MALAFILFCHAAAASAQHRCWTMVGSDGAVDEADLGIVALSSHSAAIIGTATTATVDIRYNVVAVDGIFGGEHKYLTVRFADNGTGAQVTVRLQRLNIFTGVISTLALLDSNNYAPSSVAQTQSVSLGCPAPEFDFENNIYYIEVALIKTESTGNPLIRAMQICGNGIC